MSRAGGALDVRGKESGSYEPLDHAEDPEFSIKGDIATGEFSVVGDVGETLEYLIQVKSTTRNRRIQYSDRRLQIWL